MKKFLAIVLSFILVLALSGCNNTDNRSEKKIIAVSIVPQATFLENVCGDKFDIVTMIPSGASAETYEPTVQEMQLLEKAEIYFSIGLPTEENNIIPAINKNTKIISLNDAVEQIYKPLTIGNERDPHLWLSPKRVKVMINTIAESLSEIDPENNEFYKTNAKKYCDELTALDKEITELLKNKTNRKFIAFHPAFGYFADDYSLSMYALEEHGKEADAKHLAKMIDLAKKEEIKVVFYQAETSGRQAQAFAEEIDGKAVCLEPLSADYINNLKKMATTLSEAIK